MRLMMPCGDSDDEQELPTTAPASTAEAVAEFVVAGCTLRIRTHAAMGIGFQLWPAAHAAVAYALCAEAEKPGCWRGLRVLELGAGCGLTGSALAALGAHVTLSDLEEVMPLLSETAETNTDAVSRAGGLLRAVPLCWGDAAHTAALAAEKWDMLLCCDVVYRKELFSPLVATLRALAGPDTSILISHLKRWKSAGLFWKELGRYFTPPQEVWTEQDFPAEQRRPVRVFTCTPRA